MSVIMDLRPVAHAAGDDSLPAPLDLWGDARPLPAWVRAVAYDLDVDELVDVIIGRCLGIAFPSQALDEDFSARLAASTRANANCLRSVIAGEIAIEDVYPRTRCCPSRRCRHSCGSRRSRCSAGTGSASARMWAALDRRTCDEVIVGPRGPRHVPMQPACAPQLLTQAILGFQDHRGLPGRRDLHARLRGAQPVAGARAAEPGPGGAARRGRRGCRRPTWRSSSYPTSGSRPRGGGARRRSPRAPRHRVAVGMRTAQPGCQQRARVSAEPELSTVVWLEPDRAPGTRTVTGRPGRGDSAEARRGGGARRAAAAARPASGRTLTRGGQDAERVRARPGTPRPHRRRPPVVRYARRRAGDPADARPGRACPPVSWRASSGPWPGTRSRRRGCAGRWRRSSASCPTSPPPSTCSCTSTPCVTVFTRQRSCSAIRWANAEPSCRSPRA